MNEPPAKKLCTKPTREKQTEEKEEIDTGPLVVYDGEGVSDEWEE